MQWWMSLCRVQAGEFIAHIGTEFCVKHYLSFDELAATTRPSNDQSDLNAVALVCDMQPDLVHASVDDRLPHCSGGIGGNAGVNWLRCLISPLCDPRPSCQLAWLPDA